MLILHQMHREPGDLVLKKHGLDNTVDFFGRILVKDYSLTLQIGHGTRDAVCPHSNMPPHPPALAFHDLKSPAREVGAAAFFEGELKNGAELLGHGQ